MADHDADDLSAGRFSIRLLGKPQFENPLIRRLEQDSQKTPPMVIEGPDQDMALTASLAALVNEPLANRLTLELSCTPDPALPQVPPEFRGSFLQCNPINRQRLMAAKAQGLT